MAIRVDEKKRIFTLTTDGSTYQMQADQWGLLLHLYYGRKLPDSAEYLVSYRDVGFSGNPYELGRDKTYSLDCLPQEYSTCGVGDYRETSLEVSNHQGAFGVDWRYAGYEILTGPSKVESMPSAHGEDQDCETLLVRLRDEVLGLEASLYYGVFEKRDVITRYVVITNRGKEALTLHKVMSVNVDFLTGEWDAIYLQGRHAMERCPVRTRVGHAALQLDSRRGSSGHQLNPSVILCSPDVREEWGDCYSFQLVYSGSFHISLQKEQKGSTRVVLGLQAQNFRTELKPGESFTAPQAVMSYSKDGLGSLSRQLHRFVNRHICRGLYMEQERPVLINNWEATYFDFNLDKITGIARQASELGIRLMVLDDGWFGKRDEDISGLGDWFVNENKLGGTMRALAETVNAMNGMQFGLWFEPEMISEDSDLYRAHPDWALTLPDRKPNRSRYQLVLDMSRQEIRDYLYERISHILSNANITYVKWDMNRSLSDVYSAALPADRQGEVAHRYVLGVYDLMERLTSAFPHVLFEGCSGGGGRFDLGMLYYSPQIWCSDNTDAINRLTIQYGTSLFYPIGTVGSHVSVCPNHQTGRSVPLHTRAVVAMAGSFGYEMDLQKLSLEEKEQVKEHVRLYEKYYKLVHEGDYYRLSVPDKDDYTAWEFASSDRGQALLNLVLTRKEANGVPAYVRLGGLEEDGLYRLEGEDLDRDRLYSGAALMYGGLPVPERLGEYDAWQVYLRREN